MAMGYDSTLVEKKKKDENGVQVRQNVPPTQNDDLPELGPPIMREGDNYVTPNGTFPVPASQPAGAQAQPAQTGPDYGSLSDHYLKLYADGQFNYDFNDDPKYQMARDAYMRQGQINARNVQAQAAQLTGGYGNSYGAVAAQQVMNQAANDVNQIIPELEANAYSRYAAEQNKNLGLAEMYYNMQQNQDAKALRDAQLAAEYGDYSGLQGLGIDTSEYEAQQKEDRDYLLSQRANDAEDRQRANAIQLAQLGDYSKADELGLTLTELRKEQDFNEAQRAQLREEWANASEDRKRAIAIELAKYGDYSMADELGMTLTELQEEQNFTKEQRAQMRKEWAHLYEEWENASEDRKREIAIELAKLGDYSKAEELGMTLSELRKEQAFAEEQRDELRVEWKNASEDRKREIAIEMAKYGDYSFAEELGLSLSELQKEQDFNEEQRDELREEWENASEDRKREIAVEMAKYGDYSFAEELGLSLTELRKEQENAEHERQVQDAQLAAAFGDYSGLQALGIDTSQYEADQQAAREQLLWEYARKRIEAGYADEEMAQLRKEWANAAEDRKLQIAQTLAAFGDYSALEALGVDTTQLRRQYAMSEAQVAAQYGDYSQLEALGVDVSEYKRAQQMDEAMMQAKYGDFSGLEAPGWDVSTPSKQALLSYALQVAEVGDLSLLKELGVDVSLLEAQNNYKLGQLSGYGDSGGTGGYSYNSGGSYSGNSYSGNSYSGDTPRNDDADADEDEKPEGKDYAIEQKIEAAMGTMLRNAGLDANGLTIVEEKHKGGRHYYLATTSDNMQYRVNYDEKTDTFSIAPIENGL